MNPLISVIIPTYNSAKYIREAVESALNQTYKNIEIIVVDDGSTDDTESIINNLIGQRATSHPPFGRDLAKTKEVLAGEPLHQVEPRVPSHDSRIRYFKKPNGGPASARNFGIKHARGEYIAFLDADDVWFPEKLEKQMKIMREFPKIGLVACRQYFMTPDGEKVNKVSGYHRYEYYSSSKDKLIRAMSVKNMIGGGSCSLVRKECFDKLGLFDENLIGTEDWDMWLRIAMAYEIKLDKERLLKARVCPGSVSSPTNAEKMLQNELKLVDKIFRSYDLSFIQKQKSYSTRYFVAAKALRNSGDLQRARKYLLRSLLTFPPILFSINNFKISLIIMISPMRFLYKTYRSYKASGLQEFIKKCINYFLAIEHSIVYEYDVGMQGNIEEHEGLYKIQKISHEELLRGIDAMSDEELAQLNCARAKIKKRTKQNHNCVGAFFGEKLCGYGWFSVNEVESPNQIKSSSLSEICYSFDTFVLPEYRRQGISSAIIRLEIKIMKEYSCKKMITLVAKNNIANRRAVSKLGFKEIGSVAVIIILRKFKLLVPLRIKRKVINTIELLRGEKF